VDSHLPASIAGLAVAATLERLGRERQIRGNDPSEATVEVLTAQWRDRLPLVPVEQAHVIRIDITRVQDVAPASMTPVFGLTVRCPRFDDFLGVGSRSTGGEFLLPSHDVTG
jgi:hypothetical protein